MGYANVKQLRGLGNDAVIFNQVRGHCTAHCTRWLGCLFEAGNANDYWQSLLDNGAKLSWARTESGFEANRVQVDRNEGDDLVGAHHAILMGSDDADRSPESLASSIVPMLKLCMSQALRDSMGGGSDYGVISRSGSPKYHIRDEAHRLFTMNIMRTSASGVVGSSGGVFSMDLTRERGSRNHVVAGANINGRFQLFDPNWGQFSVDDANRGDLVDAWWKDNVKRYSAYNEVDIIAAVN